MLTYLELEELCAKLDDTDGKAAQVKLKRIMEDWDAESGGDVPTATGTNGQKIYYRNGAWVDEKGAPVQ